MGKPTEEDIAIIQHHFENNSPIKRRVVDIRDLITVGTHLIEAASSSPNEPGHIKYLAQRIESIIQRFISAIPEEGCKKLQNAIKSIEWAYNNLEQFAIKATNKFHPSQNVVFTWVTKPVSVTHETLGITAELGTFRVFVPVGFDDEEEYVLSPGDSCSMMRICAVRSKQNRELHKHNTDFPRIAHPHINDNKLCMGNGYALLKTAIDTLDFPVFSDTLMAILNTYNAESPYYRFGRFAVAECCECGETRGAHPNPDGNPICCGCSLEAYHDVRYSPITHEYLGGTSFAPAQPREPIPLERLAPGQYRIDNHDATGRTYTITNESPRDVARGGFYSTDDARIVMDHLGIQDFGQFRDWMGGTFHEMSGRSITIAREVFNNNRTASTIPEEPEPEPVF